MRGKNAQSDARGKFRVLRRVYVSPSLTQRHVESRERSRTTALEIKLKPNLNHQWISLKENTRRYHTSHLWTGFIFESLGQLNSIVNSGRFESGPITLYLGGLWESFSIWRVIASDVIAEHQTCGNVSP